MDRIILKPISATITSALVNAVFVTGRRITYNTAVGVWKQLGRWHVNYYALVTVSMTKLIDWKCAYLLTISAASFAQAKHGSFSSKIFMWSFINHLSSFSNKLRVYHQINSKFLCHFPESKNLAVRNGDISISVSEIQLSIFSPRDPSHRC